MNYLKEEEIEPGSVVKIYMNGKLEGYGKLIESAGGGLSFLQDGFKVVFMKQRWLIEWADMDEITDNLPPDQAWTQKTLAGKKAHRYIEYKTSIIWDEYWENKRPNKHDWGFSDLKQSDDYGDIY